MFGFHWQLRTPFPCPSDILIFYIGIGFEIRHVVLEMTSQLKLY